LANSMGKIGASTTESQRRNQKIQDQKVAASMEIMQKHLKELQNLKSKSKQNDLLLEGMIRDIESNDANEGQVTKSMSTADWYLKWGMHYLISLRCAHLLQQCHNFKDPGVQHYGGSVFKAFQQTAQDAFVSLPPPKPTAIVISKNNAAPIAVPQNMASYYVASGGCFDGNGIVNLSSGISKTVSQLKKGDQLENSGKIVAVVKTKINDPKKYKVVCLNGVFLTPYHPVRTNEGEWKFPIDLAKVEYLNQNFVYNLILDSVHSISINGVECITLGHGFEDSVAKHDYFGTQKVINDLKKLDGWKEGLLEINQNDWIRSNSNEVCGLSHVTN